MNAVAGPPGGAALVDAPMGGQSATTDAGKVSMQGGQAARDAPIRRDAQEGRSGQGASASRDAATGNPDSVSLDGVRPQAATTDEKSPFEASLLQQYQQAMMMQLQAQMALGGLLPNQFMAAANQGQPPALSALPALSTLPALSALPNMSAAPNASSQQPLSSLPTLSNPLRSFSSMHHDDLSSHYNNMMSKGSKHLRAFHSTNENTSHQHVKGGVRKASQAMAQRSNSMSMLDGVDGLDMADMAGLDPANMDEKDLKKLRRKQSNRESARRSRLRKQAECESLQGQNLTLKTEVQFLRKENEDLKNLVLSLQDRLDTMDQQMKQVQRPTPDAVEG